MNKNELKEYLKTEVFDEKGKFKNYFDPYRKEEKIWNILFDEEGDLNEEIKEVLPDLILDLGYNPLSDAVCLYHWRNAGAVSKRSVRTIYAWR